MEMNPKVKKYFEQLGEEVFKRNYYNKVSEAKASSLVQRIENILNEEKETEAESASKADA